MAGCFGNHPFDRAMERELNNYLDRTEPRWCDDCGDDMYWDENTNIWVCPSCGSTQRDIEEWEDCGEDDCEFDDDGYVKND